MENLEIFKVMEAAVNCEYYFFHKQTCSLQFLFSPTPSALDPLCSKFHDRIEELKFVNLYLDRYHNLDFIFYEG